MTSQTNVPASIDAGATIFIPSGPSGEHLFVVIYEAKIVDKKLKVLLASIETQVAKSDMSCPLNVGDHAFIKHPSHIGYSHCMVMDMSDIQAHLKTGYYRIGDAPFSKAILAKVKAGYAISTRVPRYIKKEWVP